VAPRIQITFDCWNVHVQAAWWAERLGYQLEDVHEVVQGLLDQGVLTADDIITVNGRLAFATAAAAHDPEGKAPRMYFQAVEEKKVVKNRMHLDIARGGRELEAAVEDWVAAGASLVNYGEHPGERWAVMADPEGNEFCLQ
jgi:glyoxalase superfamily protein